MALTACRALFVGSPTHSRQVGSSSFCSSRSPLHRHCSSRSSSSNRRRIGVMETKRHGGFGVYGMPPASKIMASMSPESIGSEGVNTSGTSNPKLPPLPDKQVLVGVGTLALDFLARVESFPEPDQKIRSLDSLAQGGGNVGNALTAAARLGLRPRVFSKLSKDAAGIGILSELESDGVNTSHVVVAEEGVSPFTYIIVDNTTKTRTCIHTPGYPPLDPDELSPTAITSFLNGADLLYLDGRIPEASLLVAEEARKRHLPIIIDAERKRDRLDEILNFADYMVTSARFPQIWTEAPTLGEALICLAILLPRVKFIIATQGSAGCVMLERNSAETTDVLDPGSTLLSLQKEAAEDQNSDPVVYSSKVGVLKVSSSGKSSSEAVVGRLLVGTAVSLPSGDVVDTTGAGDAFVGGIAYGILADFPAEKMLSLGAAVAAAKCRAMGARTGLPHRNDPRLGSVLL